MSFNDFGSVVRIVQDSSTHQGTQATQTMQRQQLVRTDQAVWPEDEQREEANGPPVRLAAPEEQDRILQDVTLALPDVLLWQPVAGEEWSAKYSSYLLMDVPVSFSAETGLIPKRLKLSVQLSVEDAPFLGLPWPLPIAIWMRPSPAVDVTSTEIAHLGIDLGKILGGVNPMLKDAFTASADATVKVDRIDPRIQVTGLLRTDCEWIIADTQIAYGFRPALVAQIPARARVLVKAKAHVEVQRKFMHMYHKAYGISETHREYHYDPLGIEREHEPSPWLASQEEPAISLLGHGEGVITGIGRFLTPPESDKSPPA